MALTDASRRAGLRPEVLRLALRARDRAAVRGLSARPVLTVIDYSLPSRERRLWVLDLARARVLAHELVAHGLGTGEDRAVRFSNRPGSLQSSLGRSSPVRCTAASTDSPSGCAASTPA